MAWSGGACEEDDDEVIDLPFAASEQAKAVISDPVGSGTRHDFRVARGPCLLHGGASVAAPTWWSLETGETLAGEPCDNGWLRVELPSAGAENEYGWAVLDPALRGLHQDLLQWIGPRITAIFSEAVEIEWPDPPWYEQSSGLLLVEWAWAHEWEHGNVPAEPDIGDTQSDTVGYDCRRITIGGLPPGRPVKLRVCTCSEESQVWGAPRFLRSAWLDAETLPAQAEAVLADTRAAELPLTGVDIVSYPYVDDFHDAACQRRCVCRGCRFCGQFVFDGRAPRRFQCRRCGCHANEHELGGGDTAPMADASTPSSPSRPAEASVALTRSLVLALQGELIAAFMDDEFQDQLHEAWSSAGSDVGEQQMACQKTCFSLHAAIIANYGFKASHRGVALSTEAMESYGNDTDVARNNALLQWLTDPKLQAECPIGEMPGTGSVSQESIPLNPESLPVERAISLQRELLAQYRTPAFQDRLWKAWWAAGSNAREQHKARQLCCFEVQAVVLPKYGFEASRKGVVASHVAMQNSGHSEEMGLNGQWLYWLADPAKQVSHPFGPLHEFSDDADPPCRTEVLAMVPGTEAPVIQVRVVGGLTSDILCVVDMGGGDSVADLKHAICCRIGTPQCQQHLLLGSRPLHDPEPIGLAVQRYVLQQDPESGDDAVFDFVDVSLVRTAVDAERSNMLDALRAGNMRLVDCPEDDWADRNVVLAAVQGGDCSALRFAPAALRRDRDFVLAVVQVAGAALRYASAELLGDRDIVLAAVTSDGSLLALASEELQDDRDVALAAVWSCGLALAHASEGLQGDRHLALTAVWRDGRALAHAAPGLKLDRELCLTAVQSHGLSLEYASAKLQRDREVVITAVQNRGTALQFANPRWQRDREVCLAAVKQAGSALKYVCAELRNDFQIAMAAVREDKNALQWVGDDLAQSPSFLYQATCSGRLGG